MIPFIHLSLSSSLLLISPSNMGHVFLSLLLTTCSYIFLPHLPPIPKAHPLSDTKAPLLCRLPDFRKPHTRCGCLCYLGPYTTAIYNLTHYSQSTRLFRLLTTFLSLVQHLSER